MLALTILGNNSAVPAFGRNPTSQLLQNEDEAILIDCGEGTQLQLSRYKLKKSKISHICISHLHGDHYFGLIGLLTSMSLLNRIQPLHLHAPAPLAEIIRIQLDAAETQLCYEVHFHALGDEGNIASTKRLTIDCFKVKHRIDCWGFLFREKRKPRSIDAEKVKAHKIPAAYLTQLQQGDDYISKDGVLVYNHAVTSASPKSRSFAFCADTMYDECLPDKIRDVDLLYHETTYLKGNEEKAASRYHCTTTQAAAIAKAAGVGKLLIGHFSSKYELLEPFLQEAQEVFENTELALEGTCYKI